MKKEILKYKNMNDLNDGKQNITLHLARYTKLELILIYIDILVTFMFAVISVGIIMVSV